MMQQYRAWILVVAAIGAALPLASARAEDALLAYVGGSLGQSKVDIDSVNFSGHDFGWKALIGVRALGFIGAEAEYVDLGRPSSGTAYGTAATKANGPAVFGLAYLPLPIPLLDVYGKAGVANIQQRATLTLPGGGRTCVQGVSCDGFSRSESEFAWGGGAQVKAGPVAFRLEYEQFRASGGNLNLASVGVTYSFL
jgi:opacity protein-like surface antigen